ncbi:MAG: DJ-1/PfpI family protein [Steroidobacteraceae bacterium]
MNRREFAGLVAAASVSRRASSAATPDASFRALQSRPVTIGMLMFERMDQIDFTGPFSVLSRLPESSLEIIGLEAGPVRDHKGLVFTPAVTLANAREPDVLVVPGGPGQQDLMRHRPLLDRLSAQLNSGRVLFSVCTGALLCGAAGALRNRKATTHWASFELLPLFGATAVEQRVVVDRNLVSAAGITAGIDGALVLASLLRGDAAAQRIQLDIQYAPQPPFQSGDPRTAPRDVVETVRSSYRTLFEARRKTAQAFAASDGA